jgi:hypothetical protein
MSTMTVHLNPDLRAALIEQGWDGDEQGPRLLLVGSKFGNKKHRHLQLEVRDAGKVRLYIHPSVRGSADLKAQTIDVTNRNWAKSLARWVSLACFTLQDVWQKEDAQKACRDLRQRRRAETLAAILEPIGVSPEEFGTIAKVDWGWVTDDEIPTHTPELHGVTVQDLFGQPTTDWDGATRVRKVARLFTFLQQEGWR